MSDCIPDGVIVGMILKSQVPETYKCSMQDISFPVLLQQYGSVQLVIWIKGHGTGELTWSLLSKGLHWIKNKLPISFTYF